MEVEGEEMKCPKIKSQLLLQFSIFQYLVVFFNFPLFSIF